MPKTAGIILVGNEILSGKIEDANAVYLCRELRRLGMDVRKIAVIPDDVDVIAAEVAAAHRAWDVVFTSGGVGPTHDDVTIEGVARALGVAVVRHPELTGLLRQHYGERPHQAHLQMARGPGGAGLPGPEAPRLPPIVIRNRDVLPRVPQNFRPKVDA